MSEQTVFNRGIRYLLIDEIDFIPSDFKYPLKIIPYYKFVNPLNLKQEDLTTTSKI